MIIVLKILISVSIMYVKSLFPIFAFEMTYFFAIITSYIT